MQKFEIFMKNLQALDHLNEVYKLICLKAKVLKELTYHFPICLIHILLYFCWEVNIEYNGIVVIFFL